MTERFGGVVKDAASGLGIRHDHGSQYMSRDFQNEIAWLGAASSPAFVRAPEGNGCAERFIRTLKENLLWVRTFRTVEELRLALIDFRRTYNENWLMSGTATAPRPSSDATRWTRSRWPHNRNRVSQGRRGRCGPRLPTRSPAVDSLENIGTRRAGSAGSARTQRGPRRYRRSKKTRNFGLEWGFEPFRVGSPSLGSVASPAHDTTDFAGDCSVLAAHFPSIL